MKTEQEEKELINGKSYFGVWVGNYAWMSASVFEFYNNTQEEEVEQKLYLWLEETYPTLEHRHVQIIKKDFSYYEVKPISSIGLKALVWGRAYKVMRHFKKGIKRYKKTRAGGRIKWRRVDKKREA